MAPKEHVYRVTVEWTGNRGDGTASYRSYGREHEIRAADAGAKPPIAGSSDPAFRGDAARWNPEELLVAALSACHKLWYLHLCAEAGVVVTAYVDRAEATMSEGPDGSGRFLRAILRPQIVISGDSDAAVARDLHQAAHAKCFIANSVNFPVELEPEVRRGTN